MMRWTRSQSATGLVKFTDKTGVERLTIIQGSARTPGSEGPHVEIRNSDGTRIDPFGNLVTRKPRKSHAHRVGLVNIMSDYWEIPGFEGLYLEDSWVLSVVAQPGVLELVVDLVLHESHPSYRPPSADEQYCYRRGVVRFERVSKLTWEERGGVPSIDAAGEMDYGSIDALRSTENGYLLEGGFGRVAVSSVAPVVEFVP